MMIQPKEVFNDALFMLSIWSEEPFESILKEGRVVLANWPLPFVITCWNGTGLIASQTCLDVAELQPQKTIGVIHARVARIGRNHAF